MDYIIERMNRQQAELAIEWAVKEGWNPGLHDMACFFKRIPKAFLLESLTEK